MQATLSKRVSVRETRLSKIQYVGGVDVSYGGDLAKAAAVVLSYETLDVVEEHTLRMEVKFPYIPTLLSFREAPVVFKVFKKLRRQPDVLMIEGQGLAHPYGCGLASHVGVVLKLPTVGVAKKLLCGDVGSYEDNQAPIHYQGKIVGIALITNPRLKPIFVSVGNMLTLRQAVSIVTRCIKTARMPEPLRLTHALTQT